jgi:hypothetical protein
VHFTDLPPPAGTDYEVPETTRSPSVSPPAPGACARIDAVPVAEIAGASRDDARCVDALYQLQVLAGDWRVYMPGPGMTGPICTTAIVRPKLSGSPASATRTAAEPDLLASQRRRANELFQALSPGCREAREKLENLQRPTAHSAPSDIEKQEAWIAAGCPDVSRDGVWLADWILVRHR